MYKKPEIFTLAEGDLKELLGVAETQYVYVFNDCLNSMGSRVQDEFTFYAPAGTILNVKADVRNRYLCPAGSGAADCPLDPEIAIAPGVSSPHRLMPGAAFALDGMVCTEPTRGAHCAMITHYMTGNAGYYIVAVNPERLYFFPAATGCYTLTIDSTMPLADFAQVADDGPWSFFK